MAFADLELFGKHMNLILYVTLFDIYTYMDKRDDILKLYEWILGVGKSIASTQFQQFGQVCNIETSWVLG